MRIGIIAPPWVPVSPPANGEIEVVIDNLARGLRAVPTLHRSRCRRAAAKRFSTRRMVTDHLAGCERIVAERHPRRAA
jgi:hypothetical protein